MGDNGRNSGGATRGRALAKASEPPKRYYDIDPDTGCWNWNRCMGETGYGATRYNGQYTGAHRAYHAHYNGDIPAGSCVMHVCDNRACCNPAHLRLGTHDENMADGAAKGRINRGEANRGGGKLAEAQARLVGQAQRAGIHREVIADAFGISIVTVWEIGNGKKWKHLEEAA